MSSVAKRMWIEIGTGNYPVDALTVIRCETDVDWNHPQVVNCCLHIGHPLRNGCGLKYLNRTRYILCTMSSVAKRMWIEMRIVTDPLGYTPSHPLRNGCGLKSFNKLPARNRLRHPLRNGCGLKSDHVFLRFQFIGVIRCETDVDWNACTEIYVLHPKGHPLRNGCGLKLNLLLAAHYLKQSSVAKRMWIEIPHWPGGTLSGVVIRCETDVDWNALLFSITFAT